MADALGISLYIEAGGNSEILTAGMILGGIGALRGNGLLKDSRVKHICFDDNDFTPFE
jgi:hypothetical protein